MSLMQDQKSNLLIQLQGLPMMGEAFARPPSRTRVVRVAFETLDEVDSGGGGRCSFIEPV